MNPRFLILSLGAFLCFCPLRAEAQQVVLQIRNDRTSPVELFRVDENGAEVFYGTVLPRSLYDQPAVPGNVWRIRSGGELIHEYAPSDAPVQPVVISDTAGSRPVPAMAPSDGTAGPVQMHANDMVSLNFFSHANPHDPAKMTVPQRVALCGFPNPGGVLENIATNFGIQYEPNTPLQIDGQGGLKDEQGNSIPPHTPVTLGIALLRQWMNSPGHRNNILSGQTFFGFGVTFFSEPGPYSMISVKAVQLIGNAGSS